LLYASECDARSALLLLLLLVARTVRAPTSWPSGAAATARRQPVPPDVQRRGRRIGACVCTQAQLETAGESDAPTTPDDGAV